MNGDGVRRHFDAEECDFLIRSVGNGGWSVGVGDVAQGVEAGFIEEVGDVFGKQMKVAEADVGAPEVCDVVVELAGWKPALRTCSDRVQVVSDARQTFLALGF